MYTHRAIPPSIEEEPGDEQDKSPHPQNLSKSKYDLRASVATRKCKRRRRRRRRREEESLFKADVVNEEDPERDRATQEDQKDKCCVQSCSYTGFFQKPSQRAREEESAFAFDAFSFNKPP